MTINAAFANSSDARMAICEMTSKAEMTSRGDAKSLAKRLARQSGRNITAYRCRYCDHWHVGSKRGRP